jgi:hypothetical protein
MFNGKGPVSDDQPTVQVDHTMESKVYIPVVVHSTGPLTKTTLPSIESRGLSLWREYGHHNGRISIAYSSCPLSSFSKPKYKSIKIEVIFLQGPGNPLKKTHCE